ncbi:MAG: tRNA 2-thiouridine(34) synthase MnmA [Clostridiaceae bacterium]|nr:tRNA 2-thiouridine(34) synthase MnmA [Clostridiaceae bacterium]
MKEYQEKKPGIGAARGSVLLGLSGGVDSMASAVLLQAEGYHVTAVTLRTWQEDHADASRIERAQRSSRLLEIPHRVLDVRQAFYDEVVVPFVEAWKGGLTPNPCVMCNAGFKFAVLSDLADQLGIQYLATGHYARVVEKDQIHWLHRALYRRYDQSYFLYRLEPSLLRRLLFPVGNLSKEEVRRLAQQFHDPVSVTRDSQDICFIAKNQLKAFLGRRGLEEKRGFFIDPAGEVIGEHKGSWQYTPGQRRRLGQSFGRRMTVLATDHLHNTVTLGEESSALMKEALLTDLVLAGPLPGTFRAGVQLRSQGTPCDATVLAGPKYGEARICFAVPVRITSPGQSAVFYDGDRVLGGGVVVDMI